jgi:hypothetical protein
MIKNIYHASNPTLYEMSTQGPNTSKLLPFPAKAFQFSNFREQKICIRHLNGTVKEQEVIRIEVFTNVLKQSLLFKRNL